MTYDELQAIKIFIIDKIMENPDIMFNDEIRGDDDSTDYIDLIEVITDLFELLHKEVTGEEYDYMFHWANKIGACVDTGNFLKQVKSYTIQHNKEE